MTASEHVRDGGRRQPARRCCPATRRRSARTRAPSSSSRPSACARSGGRSRPTRARPSSTSTRPARRAAPSPTASRSSSRACSSRRTSSTASRRRIRRRRSRPSTPVAPYELATRLSYFLWGTMPDQTLFDAAAAGQLATPDQVKTQVTRMLADAKAKQAVASFHGEWLSTGVVRGVDKDKTMFPEFTDAIRADMQQELTTFVDQVFWTDGKLETLLSAPYSYMNKELATFYGVTPPTGDGVPEGHARSHAARGHRHVARDPRVERQAQPDVARPARQVRARAAALPAAPVAARQPRDRRSRRCTPGSTTRQRFAHAREGRELRGLPQAHGRHRARLRAVRPARPLARRRTRGCPSTRRARSSRRTTSTATSSGGVELAHEARGQRRGARLPRARSGSATRTAAPRSRPTSARCRASNDQFDAEGHDMRELLVNIAMSDAFRYKLTQGGGQ